MEFQKLDETQDLTIDMVQRWLRANSYRMNVSDGVGEVWQGVRGLPVVVYLDGSDLAGAVERIAMNEQRSLQALLRAINPRMRMGWPSKAAIAAHGQDENWLMKDDEGVIRTGYFKNLPDGGLCFAYDTEDGAVWLFESNAEACAFWPCDADGNKVRWPE